MSVMNINIFDSDDSEEMLQNFAEVMDGLAKEIKDLYEFRDLFFEQHPVELASEKNKYVEEKKTELVEKFESIPEMYMPSEILAEFLYLKGRCYNVSPSYDARAIQCLSKAVKLNPRHVAAWNELGECYWKNMDVKDAKASFEGALKHEKNRVALRSLSIILRQESASKSRQEATDAILKSVELAKQALALDVKDGTSWTVLGNAYLCQFFLVQQNPATLKLCMSAYKQAFQDPVAKGQPDLYYNRGIALKYEEQYHEALKSFRLASQLDPPWEPPASETARLIHYLNSTNELVKAKGKIKSKKLNQMIQTLDVKHLGMYGPGMVNNFGIRRNVTLDRCLLMALREGTNEGSVALGRVVGSIHSDCAVPFTFAMVDESMMCMCVTVYNLADGRGPIIGDVVAIPEPVVTTHKHHSADVSYEFKSIRVNNPMLLLLNGKRVSVKQFACTQVTSTYEIH